MNQWHGIGNVGAKPTLRKTASGTAVLNFSIAVDRITRVNTPEGIKTQKTPDWIPIVVFGDSAEHHAQYLQKGTRIGVTGELRTRNYTDSQGNVHHGFEVQAGTIDWLNNVNSPSTHSDVEATL